MIFNQLKNRSEKTKDRLRYLILVLSAITPFLIPLFKISHTALTRDWGYSNGVSLVTKSSVWFYKTIPIQDPWVLGGADIIANPQTRIFSPFVLFDIFLNGPYATLLSVIVMAVIGSFGVYKLLTYLKLNKNTAVFGSIIFIHSSWFALHFSEGHVVFESFLLLGLAFYYIIRIREANFKIYYALLNAFYLLDGGIYPFIFTNLLLLFSVLFCVWGLSLAKVLKSMIQQWKVTLLSGFIFASLASAKMIPLLWLHHGRIPMTEFLELPFKYAMYAFFYPFQHIMKEFPDMSIPFRFHEVGVYVGIVASIIVLAFLIISKKKNLLGFLLVAVFFFWVASGWVSAINPWLIFNKVPVLNNAHVQTRLFLIGYLMFVIILSSAIEYFQPRIKPVLFYLIISFLIAESLFVSAYPFYKVFGYEFSTCDSRMFNTLIKSNTIEKTVEKASEDWGYEFTHYFNPNTGAKNSRESAFIQGDIKSVDDPQYKGEIYLTEGKGNVELLSYTPGKIRIKYSLDTVSKIQLNTNYLLGWRSSDKSVKLSDEGWLINLKPEKPNGEVTLTYRPTYLFIILPLYILGLLVMFWVMRRRKMRFNLWI